jgi:hypothetical protein
VEDFAPVEDVATEREDVEDVGTLAVDATHVYWSDGHFNKRPDVRRRPKGGGAIEELATSPDADGVWGLAIDGTHVYWNSLSDGGVRRRPRSGGPVEQIATGQAAGLAVDDTDVYWTNFGRIQRRSKAGGPVEDFLPGREARNIRVDATHVYWDSVDESVLDPSGLGEWPGTDAQVSRRAKSGGTVERLATGQPLIANMAVDETHVYWSTENGEVRRRAKHDAAIEDIATEGFAGGGPDIALDQDNVYWAVRSTGILRRRAKQGGAIEDVATGQEGARNLVIHGADVYWVVYRTPIRRLRCPNVDAAPTP